MPYYVELKSFHWGHMYPVSQVNGTHLYIREDSNNNNKMVMMKKEIPNCTRSYGTFFTKSTLVKWKWFCRMLSVSCTNDTHCTLYGTYSFDISLYYPSPFRSLSFFTIHIHWARVHFIWSSYNRWKSKKLCFSLYLSVSSYQAFGKTFGNHWINRENLQKHHIFPFLFALHALFTIECIYLLAFVLQNIKGNCNNKK